MITELFDGLESYPDIYQMRGGTFYRGDNVVRKKPGQKKLAVNVIEVLRYSKKQVLWIWSRDVDKFEESGFPRLKEITRNTEAETFYRTWEDTWKEIAKAGKGELVGVVKQMRLLSYSAEEIFRGNNKEKGVKLVVVYLEDKTPTAYDLMRQYHQNQMLVAP
ncbi:hypothetical protein GGI35DRAFT_491999 [Trichoderma velutinum]